MPPRLVSLSFLLVICGVPLGQAAWELSRGEPVQALEVLGSIEASRLAEFEQALQDASAINTFASPAYRKWMLEVFRHGNDKAVIGEDGWIYYGKDLDLITLPGFLDGESPTALEAVLDFRDQLSRGEVELLVVPVPSKASANPRHLSSWTSALETASNTDMAAFFQALRENGVHFLDFEDLFARSRARTPDLYLARDTHWTPDTMALVARAVADQIRGLLGEEASGGARWVLEEQPVQGAGDLVGMLQLPPDWRPFEELRIRTERVLDARTGEVFQADARAPVLVLGDSFAGVFGDAQFGLGEGAGFPARLAFELDAPIDAITIAGGSSRSVRERLARRPGGVAGKSVVVWQISQRDLVAGPEAWGRVELPAAQETPGVAASGTRHSVLAEIIEVSQVSSDFDYAFCLGIVEYKIIEQFSGTKLEGPLWVAHVVMEDFEITQGAAMKVGERYRLTLDRIEAHHDLDVTAWVDDTDSGRDIWFATQIERVER